MNDNPATGERDCLGQKNLHGILCMSITSSLVEIRIACFNKSTLFIARAMHAHAIHSEVIFTAVIESMKEESL